MRDPRQAILQALIQQINIIYESDLIPVTTSYLFDADNYIILSIPSYTEEGTDNNYIYEVIIRAEVVTTFNTGETRETPSNIIMDELTIQVEDFDSLNAVLDGFYAVTFAAQSSDMKTEIDNVTTLVTKSRDFAVKVVEK